MSRKSPFLGKNIYREARGWKGRGGNDSGGRVKKRWVEKLMYLVALGAIVGVLMYLFTKKKTEEDALLNRNTSGISSQEGRSQPPEGSSTVAPSLPKPVPPKPASPPKSPPAPRAAPPASEAPPAKTPVSATEEKGLVPPLAEIRVDGQAGDWVRVPIFFLKTPGQYGNTNYGCRGVKLARDQEFLYAVFLLTTGIRELFDRELATEKAPYSHALGYLTIETEGAKISIWIPTGFKRQYTSEGALQKEEPLASIEATRMDLSSGQADKVFEAESVDASGCVAFEEKYLEFKIPLAKLGITGALPVRVSLNEM
ncbi:MAG: hypothetical protein V1918_09340 [Planctomycetota bacterium]